MSDSNSPPPLPPSSSSSMDPQQQQQRSVLSIDLNEIPSFTETLPSSSSSILSPTSLVRSFHDHHPPAEGSAAEIPSSSSSDLCHVCSGAVPETERLVCDACERGFHFGCVVGMVTEEWVCRECVQQGVASRRWKLGRKNNKDGKGVVRLFDMNASPPSDGDGEIHILGGDSSSRKLSSSDNTFGGYTSGGPLSYSNFIYPGNGFGLKAPPIVTHTVRLDFQDILHHRRSSARSFEEMTYSSQLGRIRSSSSSCRLQPWNPSEVLQSLREFVTERHGILEEGWHVELKQSKNGCESYAVYCAPDGKIFETMSDVACYLGLAANGNFVEPETRNNDGSALRRNGLHLPKRRKLTRLPVGNGFTENRDNLTSGFNNGFLSNVQAEQFSRGKSGKTCEVTEVVHEENGINDLHHFHEGLPLQYEDFFILSLGKVDTRASYHDTNQIWPVGYRSCWHDKITGSLFLCDVLDGGDSGPVFKVRRFSCSALPIPYGSTILHRQSNLQLDCSNKDEREKVTTSAEESCVEMFLADPGVSVEGDALAWLLNSPSDVDGQKASHCQPDDFLAHNSLVGEKIGEFAVDGRSSSLVWNILSQKLADACLQRYKQTGSLEFFCKHVKDGMSSFYDIMNEKNKEMFSSLDKFCSLLGSLKVPFVVNSDDELDSTVEALKNWMNLDRFGLDTEFVQELIEQCPEVHRCSRYESLKRRNGYLRSPLVGNGCFLINGKSLEQCKNDPVLDGLYREYKVDRESSVDNHCRPPGKHLGMKLPPNLVGDVLQIWELLCRFHEILGLEPLKFDELEAELLQPWFESLSQHKSCERDSPGGAEVISADGSNVLSEQASSSSSEIDRPEENRFIEMETAAMREDAQARLALSTYSKCACVSLRAVHISLLDVLVSELQIKVAAVVDPTIDGESKSRRGRKRDVDSSILAIRPKLNLLPLNELTWPELARRYILAVISMDGNLESVENGLRECGKVFRCLQGDGGVLCGSLVGVAGIEADALLLAEASKRIYGSLSSENDVLVIEDDDPESVSASGRTSLTNGNIPEWAQALEPVRKLPTNVGTRIRKCVYEALEKDPPEWAKKILEHSISKEVYKGNASGPTKKAVLSVLTDVISEGSQQKTRIEKKKTMLSIPDIITKRCRILLRRAAAADEEKMFCNLLGRNLVNSSENDEEGLLGSPAMVSRPLDFRTIDLRLAVGAYGGSHEAFLEDVRELWTNIRSAHAEQPDLVQLAETLSQNFESLYEEEVVGLVRKLKEYTELEEISTEAKKEIGDIVASTSEIPKAPWDEGVCKVCGVDKDDDSVLLCDTCDAEYHTYCLNPPLARIPEGNWYCPSCVSGVNMLKVASKSAQFVGARQRRKYHGEGIRNYLEELGRLAAVLEQKEYWEFNVEERILLLKFLCDEVLNSILIRQHLEQCSEMSADLQQRLRLLYSEWKNLKLREDVLATKAAKLGMSATNVAGDSNMQGHIDTVASHSTCTGLKSAVSERSDHITSVPDTVSQEKGGVNALHSNNQNGSQNVKLLERNVSCNSDVKQSVDLDCQVEDIAKVVNEDSSCPENFDLQERLSKRHKTCSLQESPVSNPLRRETVGTDGESSCQVKMQEVSPVRKSEDLQGASVSSACENSAAADSSSNELQAYTLDLIALQKDLSSLQQSIATAESQLLKSSVRMEFLGSDCSRRMYWVSAQPGSRPCIVVDGTMALQPKTQGMVHGSMVREGSHIDKPAPCGSDRYMNVGGSSISCPFVYRGDSSTPTCSQWVSFDSDSEIRELIKSLKDNHPKERELKDSILHWQKLRFHEIQLTGRQDQAPVVPESAEKNDAPNLLVKASSVLERKYGPFLPADKAHLKKKWKRSRVTNDEKLYRCQCLEPIWFCKHHCLSCHRTFFSAEELDKHNDSNCKSTPSATGKNKLSDELFVRNSETQQVAAGLDTIQVSRSAGSEPSRLIKYQNEESMCPYKFEEISSKFITNDSIKELVSGIGLIGSEGTPSFVPSVSPYLSDPALVVFPQETIAVDQCKISEKAVGHADQITAKGHIDSVGDIYHRRVQTSKTGENLETGNSLHGIQGERGSFSCASSMAVDPCCTVSESSLRPLAGRGAQILKQLKISLLDMEAALPEEALRVSKVHSERRRAWHAFVKAAKTIFEMVQATIVLEDMIKTEYLKNEWWYWSSLSAAAKTSTLSLLALRIYALDNAIIYERTGADLNQTCSSKPSGDVDQQSLSNLDSSDKCRQTRRATRKRKEAEG